MRSIRGETSQLWTISIGLGHILPEIGLPVRVCAAWSRPRTYPTNISVGAVPRRKHAHTAPSLGMDQCPWWKSGSEVVHRCSPLWWTRSRRCESCCLKEGFPPESDNLLHVSSTNVSLRLWLQSPHLDAHSCSSLALSHLPIRFHLLFCIVRALLRLRKRLCSAQAGGCDRCPPPCAHRSPWLPARPFHTLVTDRRIVCGRSRMQLAPAHVMLVLFLWTTSVFRAEGAGLCDGLLEHDMRYGPWGGRSRVSAPLSIQSGFTERARGNSHAPAGQIGAEIVQLKPQVHHPLVRVRPNVGILPKLRTNCTGLGQVWLKLAGRLAAIAPHLLQVAIFADMLERL